MVGPNSMASSIEARAGFSNGYFAHPNSLEKLTPVYKTGLVPITVFAMMSLLSVTVLLGFITHRLFAWRRHYREYVGYNQYVILIYNLLLADLQQSIAFSISFHWLRIDAILAPTASCFIQGWFLNLGDVASGFFVLAIAVHTWLGVVKGYKLPYIWFVIGILGIWFVSLVLTALGPALYQERFFARAGGWCWISTEFQKERLWLHYFWIFAVEFGTIAIYGHVFVHLRGRIRSIMNNDTSKLTRATKFMIMYPIAYLALTFPIAVGRMIAMSGKKLPDTFFIVAGSLLTSCGWIDALLYTLTRRILVNGDLSTGQYNRTVNATLTNAARPGDAQNYGLSSMPSKEPITSTARTVTIVGGSNRISRLVDHRRGRNTMRSKHHESMVESSPTRTGSQDSIIKPLRHDGINIITETNIQVESMTADEHSVSTEPRSRPRSETGFHRQS
ncbi:G protein-coupled glucose receptor regulating Gpa2-domain-containing protein [Phaeosphaeria sp. MPI-PUGE-AT-0046c]|nr:G protein-coupled glucose receptor regulating Gpa2-domain-containing protein [Phaeosphaeria sp. MPI-PUGE-AT-0046c]